MPREEPDGATSHPWQLYLDLLARSLTGDLNRDGTVPLPAESFREGRGWSELAVPPGETMIGMVRLQSLGHCLRAVLDDGIPGDVIETGVWRGGASIFMRGVLEVFGDRDRRVTVADSFQGMPSSQMAEDLDMNLGNLGYLSVSLEQVRQNFRKYELLDHRVEFVPGWFCDSLPALAGRTWSLIRLDGDYYESTMDGLMNLYDGLSPGGYLVVDDYGAYEPCRRACDDFREARGIIDDIVAVDWTGAYWRKTA